jgi:hypothetical protein
MYGENAGELRDALATLLRQHRITQRLGGPGTWTAPESTTIKDRASLGEQIRTYRHGVLVWCLEALVAANPWLTLEGAGPRPHDPAAELHRRLRHTIDASQAGLPSLVELTTPQGFELVDLWRRAACAAALGEHDFGADVGFGLTSEKQRLAVTKDSADVIRGLIILDARYKGIPDWRRLAGCRPLGQAAEACSVFAGDGELDYTVDLRGWQPPPTRIDGPALPGLGGVVQAQRNLLVGLGEFPNALNLRRILHSQTHLSREVARRCAEVAPELIERFVAREQTYKVLLRETRNIGGLVGNGGQAAADSMNAVDRIQSVRVTEVDSPDRIRHLDRLFQQTDARIAATIERGINEKLYFVNTKLPRVTDETVQGIQPVRERWMPVTSPVQSEIVGLALDRLRPTIAAPPTDPHPGAQESRAAYEAAMRHRPGSRLTETAQRRAILPPSTRPLTAEERGAGGHEAPGAPSCEVQR